MSAMRVDLLAGAGYAAPVLCLRTPTILVFDSGLGGLTVLREVMRQRPDADIVYAADDAAFPYGRLGEQALVDRVLSVMERLVDRFHPDLVVIACNTASTLVLPALRARFAIPFVGTVPAVKSAAERTRSGLISVLAPPGTVARDYTHDLIERYAAGCEVILVGAGNLAALAEAVLKGEPADDAMIAAEIAPCFIARDGRRTDVVTLACTHYPLLLPRLQRLAPWPVEWIDPAPAIARRTEQLLGPAQPRPEAASTVAVFTDGTSLSGPAHIALAGFGLARIDTEPLPL